MKINQEDCTSSLNVKPPKAPAIADTRMIHVAAPILDPPRSSVGSSAAACSMELLVVDVDAQVVEPFGGILQLHTSLVNRA